MNAQDTCARENIIIGRSHGRGRSHACAKLQSAKRLRRKYAQKKNTLGSEGHTQFVWTFDEGPSLDSISSQSEVVCSTDVAVLVLEVAKSQHR